MPNSNVIKALEAIEVFDIPDLFPWRIGNPNGDGGYVVSKEMMVRSLHARGDLFSFGIGNEYSFEKSASTFFRNVMMFDITSCELAGSAPNLTFNTAAFSTQILKKFKIPNGSMLKFDVEWAEWDVLLDCLNEGLLDNFSQIIGEFHLFQLFHVYGELSPYFSSVYASFYDGVNNNLFAKYKKVFDLLQKDFYCFHIHANNSLPYFEFENVTYPPLLELSFARKSEVDRDMKISRTKKYFPVTGLDVPNKKDRPDFRDVYPLYKGGEIC